MSNTHEKLHNRKGVCTPELQIRVCPVYYLYIANVEGDTQRCLFAYIHSAQYIWEHCRVQQQTTIMREASHLHLSVSVRGSPSTTLLVCVRVSLHVTHLKATQKKTR